MDNKENLNQEQVGQNQGGNWLENTDNGGAPVPEFKGDRPKDSGTGEEGASWAEEKSNHASRANEANPWAGNNPSVMSETKTPDQK